VDKSKIFHREINLQGNTRTRCEQCNYHDESISYDSCPYGAMIGCPDDKCKCCSNCRANCLTESELGI
jgi:hypothetical protein